MGLYLLKDYGAARGRTISERMANPLGFSPENQLLAPVSTLTDAIACGRYQSTPENALHLVWYQNLDLSSERQLDAKALAKVKLAPGEKLEVVRHLPGWNLLTDVFVYAGCNSDAMLTDISIVSVADPDTVIHDVATGLDLTTDVYEHFAIPAGGELIKREDSYFLKASITPPYTDADGNGVFVQQPGTPCEKAACLNLVVHAHLRNTCFKEEHRGCRIGDSNCGCSTCPAPADCTADYSAPLKVAGANKAKEVQ